MLQLSLHFTKDVAIEASYEATSDDWKDCAMRFLREYAIEGHEFITEDFRLAYEDKLPPTKDSRCYGQLMRLAAKAGIIVSTGKYKPTQSNLSHSRPMLVWAGKVKDK